MISPDTDDPQMTRIWFDAAHLYYLTQFLPLRRELERRGARCDFVFHHRRESRAVSERAARDLGLDPVWVASKAFDHYAAQRPDWVVFGGGFSRARELPDGVRTAMLYHGIGMKADVYHAGLMRMHVRFVEGPHYTRALLAQFPGARLEEVGYAKIDPLFGDPSLCPRFDLGAHGLDPAKPTVVYAPTFYPSSFPLMGDDWPARFSEFNLIVKPHQFSYTNPRCRSHRKKMRQWSDAHNVHVVPPEAYDPLPYMATADLLISDASSVLFEFAATDKPVVWCDFLKLRWSYRGLFRYRLEQRMDSSIQRYADICAHARSYRELGDVVRRELAEPERHAPKRREYTAELIGKTDGRVCERIADRLLGV
jgi:hypothetical protein